MNSTTNISARVFLLLGFSSILFAGYSLKKDSNKNFVIEESEREPLALIPEAIDSPDLKYPYVGTSDPNKPRKSLVGLDNPLNVKRRIRYNSKTGRYEFISTLGDSNSLNNPISMSLEEFRKYQEQKAQEDYWKSKIEEDNSANSGSFVPQIDRTNREFGDICEGKLIDINPQGSAELRFGLNTTRTDNPAIPVQQRQLTTFDFDQQIQLNIQGSICDKFNLNFNYNTEATFDFENQTKLAYEGTEDQILQKIEAGNVTYPIQNTLIQGSQSLFGVRTDLKFGKLNISTVISQNRGERKEINIKNGAQQKEFELPINNYEANRHYFLNHYHRDNYDRAMSSLPNVSSQIRITRMEVWVTNRVNDFDDTRNIVAFSDLGETRVLEGNPQVLTSVNGVPDNDANNLYQYLTNTSGTRSLTSISATLNSQNATPGPFVQSQHYERLENARLLSVSEYNYNSILGYLSLNQPLNNDEILGVAYQYTYQGKTYQVGEFSTDGVKGNDVLFLKMLKGTINSPRYKVWDLMMKNIYSIGAFQINQENFRMDVWYNNPKTGVEINYIPQPGVDNKLALQLIGADIINQQQQPFPDGVFDFIPLQFNGNRVENGGTINPQNGRIIFSKIEPFGPYLEQQLLAAGLTPTVVNTIAFPQLYDSTQTIALQYPELNRFMLRGTYESANSSEISLNAFNIPQGSVTVTAGGVRLVENQDYTVDYNIGRVKILNDGVLNSGTPIKISLESNSLFTAVQKTMIGTHFDYRFNRDFNLGATMLRLSERPLTQKVNIGDEPVRNTMLGINGNFQRDAPWLTRLVDNIPFINTKEKSSITASLEAAYLIPGHNPAIGDEGQSFIDDFEGSQSAIDIRSFNTWVLASIPQGQPDLFPEAQLIDNLDFGKNRALFNWNVYDPSVFYEERGLVPGYIDADAIQNNHQMRLVEESELFPNRSIDPTAGQIDRIAMFNLAFFPSERGPYNYDTDRSIYSAGLNNNGNLNAPQTRWGGIMRQLQTNDFENANIEYIQFWVMDPFSDSDPNGSNEDATNTTGGELYINLGNVSEDILRDGIKTFENGLTTDGVFDASVLTTTSWGRVPTTQQILTAFDNNPATRQFQDVGLDGLSNTQEQAFYDDYVNWVNASSLTPAAKARLLADPSGDDYRFYRDDQYDNNTANIIDRYKEFNGLEGNSATDEQSQNLNAEGYPTSKTTIPDLEDINRDNNLNETEAYYQYKMNLVPQEMEVGKNYIVDKVTRTHQASGKQVDWYQFRVPVRQPSKIVNGINDFRSIRFMRIFMRGFQDPIILRFARLELLRGTWRRYDRDITDNGEYIQNDPSGSIFNISAVNIEENSSRNPIDYTLPPNFQREINPNSAVQAFLNEQSLEMELCGLRDGIARAAFRNVEFDVLNYKKIKMFVHGEQHTITNDPVKDDDVTIFVRIGTDFEFNYYEYEMPIKMTQYGAVSPEDVWPEENNLEIVLEDLKNLKIARNNSGAGASILSIFEQAVPGKPEHVIKVIGNPNLQDLKTIMIGVRNPNKDKDHPWQPDDGQDKCVKVWVNELRMTDFENSGGWAAQSRVQATLADFATVSLAGQISTPGFGGIEQRVSERQRETIRQVDAATSIQLGKFFGPNAGVQFPLFIGFSEGVIDPQFDPLNPDIEFDRSIQDASIEEQQQRIRDARDITVRRSLNFTNVRIAPKKKSQKNFPWDIQNFAFTYAYSELYRRDIQTQYDVARVYNGGLNYTYQTKNKPYTPFKNNKFLRSSPWFKLIRDINIDPLPKQFAFNTNMDRTYNESKARDITGNALIIPQFTKTFTWDRNYDLNWNLMQGLRINFNANNQAFIEEPGDLKVDRELYPNEFEQNRDSVLRSLGNFGENNHYLQNANITYTWPLKKIPVLSFVNLTTKYQATYDWQRAPLSQDSLGNTIQNSRNIAWNGSFNMQQLYNKVPYFKKVNQKSRNRARSTSRTSRTRTSSKKGEGKDDDDEDDKKKKKDKNALSLGDGLAKIIMSLQNVTFSYSTIDGQLLPGYSPPSEFLGMTNSFSTPGVGFVFGGEQERDFFGRQTNNDFARTASQNGWLVGPTSKFINAQRTTNHSKNFNTRFTFEPFKGMRVELTANYLSSENMNENFIWNDSIGDYDNFNTLRTGNVSYSFNSIRTAFVRNDSLGNSPLFQELLDNRIKASEILNARNSDYTDQRIDTTGFYDGYNGGQSQVVLASFMAAYSGKELTARTLNPLSALPNLNWRVTIDGLNRLPAIRKIFRSIVFTHAYNSTFTVANFNTDLEAVIDPNGNSTNRDASGNIRAEQQILSVAITEQFNPLFKVDATWQNSLITKFEYRSNRNISLSLTNNRITELKGTEITIGTGYRFQNVKFPIKIGKKTPISDINARLDFSLRDNKTIIRNIDEEQNQITAGQQYIAIKGSADYVLNKQFTLRFYYDRVMTNPAISTAFPTMNQNFGFAVRVNLFQ